MTGQITRRCAAITLIGTLAAFSVASAAEPALQQPEDVEGIEPSPSDDDPLAGGEDLLNLDLDQLARADVKVTALGEVGLDTVVSTVSRTDTSVRQTPSAVYVLTQEMIHRSGARNVMEALRTVPGLHVARINANAWAISIRGFNGSFADKLLVQIDGRPIYNQFFSGVFWELQLIPLQDIERIEVIRGSGGAVWGANAVNGVINVVTKDSRDTTGVFAEGGGGNEHRSFSHARVGGQIGKNANYRVYGAQIDEDSGLVPLGDPADARRGTQVGFRLDWRPNCDDTITLQGDLADVTQGVGAPGNENSLGNILWRWNRQIDDDTDWSVQAYYDRLKVDYGPGSLLADVVWQNSTDLDAKLHKVLGAHEWVCGIGYRNYETFNASGPGQALDFEPDKDVFDSVS
ncbi:Colicin I receptor precursor [Posidoniimonas polymericola]|uniref:Colicin I receptor n=1 Tax=Posidoniimonas polymericola TaxID=2528002 RepID=A0A5C5YF96_9BACT|nr:TonB-dependent receptor plug domain-containing protein [Posidoniimonas polymericola]TWT73599.1 Colicin I receptor precursor [Posidoniimonas polymericola]